MGIRPIEAHLPLDDHGTIGRILGCHGNSTHRIKAYMWFIISLALALTGGVIVASFLGPVFGAGAFIITFFLLLGKAV